MCTHPSIEFKIFGARARCAPFIVIRALRGLKIIRQAAAEGYIVTWPMEKQVYVKLTDDIFKIQRRILTDLFTRRSLMEITQKWGLPSMIIMLPYIMIVSSSFRKILLSLPPKILMKLINHYLHIAHKII